MLDHATIRRCINSACGLGFTQAQPDDARLASYYEEFYYPEHGSRAVFENSTRHKFEQHYERLDRRLGLGGKQVLDYGCGVGNFLDVAGSRGSQPAGLEFDPVARRSVAGKGYAIEASIHAYPPESFDLIYVNDVIEHLRDPVEEMALVRSRLRPGGAAFVVTMNMRGLKPRVAGSRWDVVTNPTHLWFYDERSLVASLERAGFSRCEVQRWPVRFEHHGAVRSFAQRALQASGLDASLRVLAWSAG